MGVWLGGDELDGDGVKNGEKGVNDVDGWVR